MVFPFHSHLPLAVILPVQVFQWQPPVVRYHSVKYRLILSYHQKLYDRLRQSWYSSHLQSHVPCSQDGFVLYCPQYQRTCGKQDSLFPCQSYFLWSDRLLSDPLHSRMAVLPYRIRFHRHHATIRYPLLSLHFCFYSLLSHLHCLKCIR